MKHIKMILCLLITSNFLSIGGYGQQKDIISKTEQFNYLIGKEYTKVSELGDFTQKTRGMRTDSTGFTTMTATLLFEDHVIITSEHIINNDNYDTDTYKILDLIVLNELCIRCTSCLITNNQNTEILTLHPLNSRLSKESIIAAFTINLKNGKFKKTNPNKFDWNKNAL